MTAEILKDLILPGLFTTVFISFLSFLAGSIPGVIIFLGKSYRLKSIHYVCTAYTELLDGIPQILQIFFLYYALPLISPALTLSQWTTGLIFLALNAAARIALTMEISNKEKAKKLTIVDVLKLLMLSSGQVLPTIINYSTLLSLIGLTDFVRATNVASARFGNTSFYVFAVIVYLILNISLKLFVKWIYKRFYKV